MTENKIKVMVIDDSLVFRSFLSNSLKKFEDIDVVGTAMNGKAALASLPLVTPDVCTLDVEMPVMGGIETLKEIRAKFPKIQVIMVSSQTSEGADITLQAMELGACDFALKDASQPDTRSDNTQNLPLLLSQKIRRAHRTANLSRQINAADQHSIERKKKIDSAQNLIIPGSKPLFISISCEESSLGHLLLLMRNLGHSVSQPMFFKIMVPDIFLSSLVKSFERNNPAYKYCLGTPTITFLEPKTVYLLGEKHSFSISSYDPKLKISISSGGTKISINQMYENLSRIKIPNTPLFLLGDDLAGDGVSGLKSLTAKGYPTVFVGKNAQILGEQKNILANTFMEVGLFSEFLKNLMQ